MDPRPTVRAQAALEVVMLGHIPGGADYRFLLDSPSLLAEIESLGYAADIAALRTAPLPQSPLFNLPVPVESLAQFKRLFPRFSRPTVYRSKLAGSEAWLPLAVEDFFRHQDSATIKKLWVISVDESAGQDAFLPSADDDWLNPRNAGAFTRALMIPRAGLLAMPDLERLQIPAQLDDIPRLRLANPAPSFLPCSDEYDDTHRERRHSSEMPRPVPPREFAALLAPISRGLHQHRPDMHLLFALPFDPQQTAEQLQPSAAALTDIENLQQSPLSTSLHRVQLTWPYLRSAQRWLISSSGLLAGQIATRTAVAGAWRSVAGQRLAGQYHAYPPVNQQTVRRLREQHNIGVLQTRRDSVALDDERILGGVFGEPAEHARSGEIARFIGWLRRELESLGRQLLFDVDPGDPRPAIALREFFTRLHRLGALRGRMPEDAFEIRRLGNDENTLIFEIDIAPAFPIDRIRLSLTQDALEIEGAGSG